MNTLDKNAYDFDMAVEALVESKKQFAAGKIGALDASRIREKHLGAALEAMAASMGVTLDKSSLQVSSKGEFSIFAVKAGETTTAFSKGCGQYGEKFAQWLSFVPDGIRTGTVTLKKITADNGWCFMNHFAAEKMVLAYHAQKEKEFYGDKKPDAGAANLPAREALNLRLAEGERNGVYAIDELIKSRIILQLSGGGPAEALIIRADKKGHFSSAVFEYKASAFGDAVLLDLTGEEAFLLLNSTDDALVGGPLMDQSRASSLKNLWLPMVRDQYHYEQVRMDSDALPVAADKVDRAPSK